MAEIKIQVAKGVVVPLQELIEDEKWGALPGWAGQQALKRFRETGETGLEDTNDGYSR